MLVSIFTMSNLIFSSFMHILVKWYFFFFNLFCSLMFSFIKIIITIVTVWNLEVRLESRWEKYHDMFFEQPTLKQLQTNFHVTIMIDFVCNFRTRKKSALQPELRASLPPWHIINKKSPLIHPTLHGLSFFHVKVTETNYRAMIKAFLISATNH